MNRTYYRLSTIVDKNQGQGPRLETEITELDDENLPPMHVIIDACYIIIQTFYRRFSKAVEAEEEAHSKWQAGKFNDFLDELITELAKYKTTDNQTEVKTVIQKNDPLPDVYRNFPYQYITIKYGIVLRKNDDEVFLEGDDETSFIRECNRAKQKGRNVSDVIDEYF